MIENFQGKNLETEKIIKLTKKCNFNKANIHIDLVPKLGNLKWLCELNYRDDVVRKIKQIRGMSKFLKGAYK